MILITRGKINVFSVFFKEIETEKKKMSCISFPMATRVGKNPTQMGIFRFFLIRPLKKTPSKLGFFFWGGGSEKT